MASAMGNLVPAITFVMAFLIGLEKINIRSFRSIAKIVGTVICGIIGSGISFFVQAWVISQRGPLFSAMFNPLSTVIVTVLAAIFLHEEIYTGSGEMSMALLKGPKLLNTELLPIKSSSTGSGSKTWLLGSIILFGNSCSIVIWKIVQNRFQYQLGVLIPYSLLFGCVSSDPYNNSNYDLHKTRSTSMETAFNS
ncbi:hypothetical protein NC653_039931 [Populus alba x Populus x berolinensis]|uniref:WAT1-related protein n=1 Tax=Populus alba x Populus x berolinensis TaxID=444605 RepID=A0AAD6LCH6_9ROSI|nr:hypothetical protein NC653_039931 [Populus alba x Populus x berolinensis]